MKLTITKSEGHDNWYLIERAEHDGREWRAPLDGGAAFCKSSRICGDAMGATPPGFSASIEGTATAMLEIAEAIERRCEVSFNRCSVDARSEPVLIGSPRNGNGVDAEVTREEADDLAAKIRAMLAQTSAG